MKNYRYLGMAVLVAAFCFTTVVSAKRTAVDKVYMFGFAASFNDSTVYFTDVQAVDSAWMDTKTKFLLGRENYSYQLRNYLTDNLNEKNRTCIVMFGLKKEKVEKKYLKLKKQYTVKANNKFIIKHLTSDDFKFVAIDMSEPEVEEVVAETTTTETVDNTAPKQDRKPKKNKRGKRGRNR